MTCVEWNFTPALREPREWWNLLSYRLRMIAKELTGAAIFDFFVGLFAITINLIMTTNWYMTRYTENFILVVRSHVTLLICPKRENSPELVHDKSISHQLLDSLSPIHRLMTCYVDDRLELEHPPTTLIWDFYLAIKWSPRIEKPLIWLNVANLFMSINMITWQSLNQHVAH